MTKPKPVRICPHCHKKFTRYGTLGYAAFAIVGHCGSKKCMEAAKAKGRPSVKPCEVCKCDMHKRPHEAWRDFMERKTCGAAECVSTIYALRTKKRHDEGTLRTKHKTDLYPHPKPSPVTAAILGLR